MSVTNILRWVWNVFKHCAVRPVHHHFRSCFHCTRRVSRIEVMFFKIIWKNVPYFVGVYIFRYFLWLFCCIFSSTLIFCRFFLVLSPTFYKQLQNTPLGILQCFLYLEQMLFIISFNNWFIIMFHSSFLHWSHIYSCVYCRLIVA